MEKQMAELHAAVQAEFPAFQKVRIMLSLEEKAYWAIILSNPDSSCNCCGRTGTTKVEFYCGATFTEALEDIRQQIAAKQKLDAICQPYLNGKGE